MSPESASPDRSDNVTWTVEIAKPGQASEEVVALQDPLQSEQSVTASLDGLSIAVDVEPLGGRT